MDNRKQLPGQLGFQVILLSASLILLWQAFTISGLSSVSGAGVFPMLAAGAMSVSMAVSIVKGLRPSQRERGVEQEAVGQQFFKDVMPPIILGYIALCALYVAALEYVGFQISTALFLFCSFLVLHRGSIVTAAAMALGFLAATYVLFSLIFQVYLP